MAGDSAAHSLGSAMGSGLFASLVFAAAVGLLLGHERRTRPRGGAARSPQERATLFATWSWLCPAAAIGCSIVTLGVREPLAFLLKSIAGSVLMLVGLGAGVWTLVAGRRTGARGVTVPAALGVGGTLLLMLLGAISAVLARAPRPSRIGGAHLPAAATFVSSATPAPTRGELAERPPADVPDAPNPLVTDLRPLPGSQPGERCVWARGVLVGASWVDGDQSTVRRWPDLAVGPVAVARIDGIVTFAQAVPAGGFVALGVQYEELDTAALRKPSALVVLDPKSGASRIAAEAFAGFRFRFDVAPVWSPDGKQVAVLGGEEAPGAADGASGQSVTTRLRIFDTTTRRSTVVPAVDGAAPFAWDSEGLLLVGVTRLGTREFYRWDPRSRTAAIRAPLTVSSPAGRFRIEVALDGIRISPRTGEPRRFEPAPSERLGVARLMEWVGWLGDRYLVLEGEALEVLDLEAAATRYLTRERTTRFLSASEDGRRFLVRTSDGALRVGTVP